MLLTLLTLAVLALPAVYILGYLCGRHDGREAGVKQEQERTSGYISEAWNRIWQAYYRDEVGYQVDGRRGVAISSKIRVGRN